MNKLIQIAQLLEDRKNHTPKIVTFDFDHTLSDYNRPIEKNINQLKYYAGLGAKVYIVTARTEANEGLNSKTIKVSDFVKKYNLPISGIYFTNSDLKANTLKQLGSELHYDDSDAELLAIQSLHPEIKTVKVTL